MSILLLSFKYFTLLLSFNDDSPGLMESLYEELRSMNKEKPLNINFTTVYPYMVNTGLCKNPYYR